MNDSNNNERKVTQEVQITDIKMPFFSMVIFMIKWVFASIPAVIIIGILGTLISWFAVDLIFPS